MAPVVYNSAKFKEAVLYVARACAEDPYFGAVKLNKILFYADFTAYARWGKSITGAEYRKYPHGPAPARMKAVKEELQDSREAHENTIVIAEGRTQKRLEAGRPAKTEMFTPEELTIINESVEALWGMTATQVSTESHRFPGWKYAIMGETIPYATVFLAEKPLPLSEKDKVWARGRIATHLCGAA
jgi:hypothetical protein